MNEVGRSADLLAVLGEVLRDAPDRPIALVEPRHRRGPRAAPRPLPSSDRRHGHRRRRLLDRAARVRPARDHPSPADRGADGERPGGRRRRTARPRDRRGPRAARRLHPARGRHGRPVRRRLRHRPREPRHPGARRPGLLPRRGRRRPARRRAARPRRHLRARLPDDDRARFRALLPELGRDLEWISVDPLVPLGPDGRHSVQGLPVPERAVAACREASRASSGGCRCATARRRAGSSGSPTPGRPGWSGWTDPQPARATTKIRRNGNHVEPSDRAG